MSIDVVREQMMRDLARGTSDLPAVPRGVGEALKLARSPDFELEQVETLAESDPPIAARLLATANSALYSRGEPLASVRRAVIRLGTQAVRDVLYQAAYASMLIRVPRFQNMVEASFKHGVVCARIARRIAAMHQVDPDAAFLAGLLHDLGRARCWKLLASRSLGTISDEDLLLVVDELHTKAGSDLAAAWQLPPEVVEACLYHHEPGARIVPRIIYASDVLARLCEERLSEETATQLLESVGIPRDQQETFIALARQEIASSEAAGLSE